MEAAEAIRRPPAMKRCECTGLSFEELARRLAEPGRSMESLQQETGCGLFCSACIPDLERLARRAGER